jgi:hypothetical protein
MEEGHLTPLHMISHMAETNSVVISGSDNIFANYRYLESCEYFFAVFAMCATK